MKTTCTRIAIIVALALCGVSATASIDLSAGTATYTWVQTDSTGTTPTGPGSAGGTAVAVNPGLFAIAGGYWVPNNSVPYSSKTWISVDQYAGLVDGSGSGSLASSGIPKYGTGNTWFLFSTTFNSGPNTSLIGTAWFADNEGVAVMLIPPGTALAAGTPSFSGPSGASFSAALTPNTDYTVNFLIENFAQANGNPLGLNVNMSAVPEPTTMIAGALLLLPFGASTLRMLRKNCKA